MLIKYMNTEPNVMHKNSRSEEEEEEDNEDFIIVSGLKKQEIEEKRAYKSPKPKVQSKPRHRSHMPSMEKKFSPREKKGKNGDKMLRTMDHQRSGRSDRPRGRSVISNADSQSDAEGVFTNVTRLGMLEELDDAENNYNW